jgi:uncharacterized protein with GYD domain
MRKITHAILIGVAAFVLLIVGTLVVRSRAARVESLGGAATGADLHIKEVDLEEESKGIRWRLRAKQALMYEREGRTTLKEPSVQVFERDRSWTVVGEEGDVDKATRMVTLRKEDGSTLTVQAGPAVRNFDQIAAKAGVKIEGQYWTMGKYDGVLIVTADSEEKVLHMLTLLAAFGNVRTNTMQAFVDKEFDSIVGK